MLLLSRIFHAILAGKDYPCILPKFIQFHSKGRHTETEILKMNYILWVSFIGHREHWMVLLIVKSRGRLRIKFLSLA